MIKTRVVDGRPISNYTEVWLEENKGNIINGALVSDWKVVILYDGSFVKPFWNGSVWIESETQENIYKILKDKYSSRVNNYFSYMYTRALSSSMNKSSTDINFLLGLREEYQGKYDVSKRFINTGLTFDGTTESLETYIKSEIYPNYESLADSEKVDADKIIKNEANTYYYSLSSIYGEMLDEFNATYLDEVLQAYGQSITGTHFDKMFRLIIFKFEYGLKAFNNFKNFIQRFRTKCNKWIDGSSFSKLDSAFSLVDNLPKTLDVPGAQALFNQFNAI